MIRKKSIAGQCLGLAALALVWVGIIAAAATARATGAEQAAEQPAQKPVSPKVGKSLRAAQELMQKQDWDGALAKIQEADAVTGKTPVDDFQIAEMLGYVQLKRQQYAEAAAAFEKSLASGMLPAEQTADRLKLVTQLALQLKDFPKAVQFGTRMIEATPNPSADLQVLLAEAQYFSNDYKAAATTITGAIESARKAGKPIPENWLQIELSAYGQLKDAPGVLSARQQLAVAYPKKEYLEDLFKQWKYTENDDPLVLSLHRLMFELGLLKEADDYLKLARLAVDAGTPGEAVRVLEQGKANKVFADEVDTERARRQLESAKTIAVADRKSVQALEQTKQQRSAEEDVQLGTALASYEEYPKAIEALQRGLAAGGVKRPDKAQIVLGYALIKAGRPDDAKAAFESVQASSSLKPVAELWRVYTVQPPSTATAPPAS